MQERWKREVCSGSLIRRRDHLRLCEGCIFYSTVHNDIVPGPALRARLDLCRPRKDSESTLP